MTFKEVVGHQAIKANLAETIRNNRVSHAQLFVSDEGVGALPLAMAYAQRLLCTEPTPEGDSCQKCSNCYKMERLEHPDCHYVMPVNRTKKARATGRSDEKPTSDQFVHLWREIMIQTKGYISEEQWYDQIGMENQQGNINKEEANEILRKMSFKSVQGSYKIVILWLPERLHETAANTLLKLIEEPAPQTLFILVSEEPDKIIATIRSRTQRLNLAPLPEHLVEQHVAQMGYPTTAASVASAANGSLSRAIALAQSDCQSDDSERLITLMRKGYTMKYSELFDWAETMAAIGREAQKTFCENSISTLRDCYLTGVGLAQITHPTPEVKGFVTNFAPFVNHQTIEPFVREFELLLSHVRQNGNPKILFGDFALKISKIIRATAPKK